MMSPVSPNARRRWVLAALLVLVLLVTASPFAGRVSAQRPDSSALAATDDVLKVVSRLRHLSIVEPVKSGFKTHDQIEESVIKDLDDSTSPAEMEATSKTLLKLGLIPKDFALRPYTIKMLREQVAGYYDPKTKFFYLASWLPLSDQKTVMAHELTHALQDQHFNLRRFDHWPKGDSDAELAAHALVEGEATIIMLQYSAAEGGYEFDVTKVDSLTDRMLASDDGSDSAHYPILAGAPAVLRDNLQFPYVYGVGFVQQVLKQGSWPGVDRCYTHLPMSTKQVMHPEAFFAQDNPTKIELPDLAKTLGAGWALADQDVNGEFGYLEILSKFDGIGRGRGGSSGWAGDRYCLLENKATGNTILAQFTSWDTAAAAYNFFDAYDQRTVIRYKLDRASSYTENSCLYRTSEGLAYIERRDRDVVIVEGASTQAQLTALTEQLWHSKKVPPAAKQEQARER